jgi:hypothetical protein
MIASIRDLVFLGLAGSVLSIQQTGFFAHTTYAVAYSAGDLEGREPPESLLRA